MQEPEEGTTWRGWGHYVKPVNFYPGWKFTIELTVTKREGNQTKGIYKSDNGKTEWEVEGTITNNIMRVEKTKRIKGGLRADVSVTFEGKIQGDRIDIEIRHLTPQGEPALAIGSFIRDKD